MFQEPDGQLSAPQRYTCPYPGCTRSFRDFWRLKVHYRAPPSARGSGVERGHGMELPYCPLCNLDLRDVKYHKCSAAPGGSAGGGRRTNGAAGGRVSAQQLQQQYLLPRPGLPHGPIALPTGNLPYHAAGQDGGYAWQRPLPPHAGLPHMGPPGLHHHQQQAMGMMQPAPQAFNPAGLLPPQQLQPMPEHTADGLTPRAAAAAAAGIPLLQQPQQGAGDPAQQQQWWANQPPSPPPLPQEQQQQHWHMQPVSQQQLPVPAAPGGLALQQQPQQPFQQQMPPPNAQQQMHMHMHQQAQQHHQQQQHLIQQRYQAQQHLQQAQQQFLQPRLSGSGGLLPGLPAGLTVTRAGGRDQHMVLTPRAADTWQQQQQQASLAGLGPAAVSPSAVAAAAAAMQPDSCGFSSAPVVTSCWPQLDMKPLNAPPASGAMALQQYGSYVTAGPTLTAGGSLTRFDPMQSSSSAATTVPPAVVMTPAVGAAAAGALAAGTAAAACAAPGPGLTGDSPEDAAVYEQVVQQFRADLADLRTEIINSCKQPSAKQQQRAAAAAPAAQSPEPAAANHTASSSNSSPTTSAAAAAGDLGCCQQQQHEGKDLIQQGSGVDSSAAAAGDAEAAAGAAAAAGSAAAPALAGTKRSAAEPRDETDDSEQDRDKQDRDNLPAKRQATISPIGSQAAAGAAGAGRALGVPARAAWTDTPPPPEAPAALLQLASHVDLAGGPAAAAGHGGKAAALQSAAVSGSSSPASSVCEAPSGTAAGTTQDVHAAKVSSLIASAMQSASQLGLPDPRGLMPRLLEVLNEHISALSEIHDAETTASPQVSLPAVADAPLIAGAAVGEGTAAAAVAAAGRQQQQPVSCLQQQQQLMVVSAPLQQLPWEQPLDVAAEHGHCFFDHIDRTYDRTYEQQHHLAAVDHCPAGASAMLSALPTPAVAADS